MTPTIRITGDPAADQLLSSEPLRAAGGTVADSIATAVAGADVVATMLSDGAAVESVLQGPGGVLESAREGSVWIDFSTIEPATSIRLSSLARERGLRPIDAPVSGGEIGAIEGTLSIMVGGEEADLQSASWVMEAVGRTIVHVGPDGSGQVAKAANQLIVAANIEALAEAVLLLRGAGVDPARALGAIAGGLAGSRVLDVKSPGMLEGRYAPGFRVALHDKDLGIVRGLAERAGLVLPLASVVADLMRSLKESGHGDDDHSALLLGLERANGR